MPTKCDLCFCPSGTSRAPGAFLNDVLTFCPRYCESHRRHYCVGHFAWRSARIAASNVLIWILRRRNTFQGLCRYLRRTNIAVDVLQVSFVQPQQYALEIIQTCDIFYMCGGDPGQTFPLRLAQALRSYHTYRYDRGPGPGDMAGKPLCARMMVALHDRVQYNSVLYMGTCMGAILAGKSYCGRCRIQDAEVNLFDFLQGTSVAYQSCQSAKDCTVDEVTVNTIKITSGCATSIHIWHGTCSILAFPTLAKTTWNAYCDMPNRAYLENNVVQIISTRGNGPWYCRELGVFRFWLTGAYETIWTPEGYVRGYPAATMQPT